MLASLLLLAMHSTCRGGHVAVLQPPLDQAGSGVQPLDCKEGKELPEAFRIKD